MQRGTSYIPRLRYNPRPAQAAYRRRACVARVRASVRVGRAYTVRDGVTAVRSRVRASCTVLAG
ncbi:hypothetical protein EXIGLDRAFT_734154 [Exidia glandulosa HHB12029]|uniref:Uncharacterized protein n=1 Tax=Exidia glandulosa HHB12029 TaxID=1314781 RepID=A0A165B5A1_EXIGL|nr:hypothetical protein EXIGLDRAFT_734154 [Exidia glandulosa HHB12029]